MGGLSITATTKGGEKIFRQMRVSMKNVKDLTPAWKKIEKLIYDFQKKLFLNKGASEGLDPWKPLAASTIKAKMRDARQTRSRYRRAKLSSAGVTGAQKKWATYPLIRTGNLMDVATRDAISIAPLRLAYTVDPIRVPYAIYHQRGGKRLPKREIIRWEIFKSNGRMSLVRKMEKIIQAHLVSSGQLERENRIFYK